MNTVLSATANTKDIARERIAKRLAKTKLELQVFDVVRPSWPEVDFSVHVQTRLSYKEFQYVTLRCNVGSDRPMAQIFNEMTDALGERETILWGLRGSTSHIATESDYEGTEKRYGDIDWRERGDLYVECSKTDEGRTQPEVKMIGFVRLSQPVDLAVVAEVELVRKGGMQIRKVCTNYDESRRGVPKQFAFKTDVDWTAIGLDPNHYSISASDVLSVRLWNTR